MLSKFLCLQALSNWAQVWRLGFSFFNPKSFKIYPICFPCGLFLFWHLNQKLHSLKVIPLLSLSRLYHKLGYDPWLFDSYRLNGFLLAPPNKDIDKIGRPPKHQGWIVQLDSTATLLRESHVHIVLLQIFFSRPKIDFKFTHSDSLKLLFRTNILGKRTFSPWYKHSRV